MWDKYVQVRLPSVIDEKVNELGDVMEDVADNIIIAEKRSVKSTEFWQADATGKKPEMVIKIHFFEYSDQKTCIVDGKEYDILRDYCVDDMVELTLARRVNHGTA